MKIDLIIQLQLFISLYLNNSNNKQKQKLSFASEGLSFLNTRGGGGYFRAQYFKISICIFQLNARKQNYLIW